MHLLTTLSSKDVIQSVVSSTFDCFKVDHLRQTSGSKLTGDWEYGVFCIEDIHEEDKISLRKDLGLPDMKTRFWINCEPVYEGQTAVYQLTSEALKKWHGDLALLHDGDSVEVQRINGEIRLRADYLNPERLVFYRDFAWKPLPLVQE